MLARSVVLVLLTSLTLACSDVDVPMPSAGDPCTPDADCGAVLECQHLVCVDDRGPEVRVLSPEALQIFDAEPTMLAVVVGAETEAADDRVVVSIDPDGPTTSFDAFDPSVDAVHEFSLSPPLASGPHRVIASVEHGDGSPYLNPSAHASVPLFVRDAVLPDTPMVVITWPPPGYRHPVGADLEVEVAVLPGSFTFVDESVDCPPAHECTPAFAPECEADCGPVSREGHAKMFLRDGFPDCLLEPYPDGCGWDYVMILRPNNDYTEVLDDYRLRGLIPGVLLTEIGPTPLTAMLSYGYHTPYPNDAEAVHDTIMIEIVE